MSRYLTKMAMFGLVVLASACGGGGGGGGGGSSSSSSSSSSSGGGATNLIPATVSDMSADVSSVSNWNKWPNQDGQAATLSAGADAWAGTMEATASDYGTASTTHDGVDATDHAWYSQIVPGDGTGTGNGTFHLQVGKVYQAKVKAASTVPDQTIELVIQTGGTPDYHHWLTFPFVPTATLTEYSSPTFTVDTDQPSVWYVIGLGGNSTSGAVFHFDDAQLLESSP